MVPAVVVIGGSNADKNADVISCEIFFCQKVEENDHIYESKSILNMDCFGSWQCTGVRIDIFQYRYSSVPPQFAGDLLHRQKHRRHHIFHPILTHSVTVLARHHRMPQRQYHHPSIVCYRKLNPIFSYNKLHHHH